MNAQQPPYMKSMKTKTTKVFVHLAILMGAAVGLSTGLGQPSTNAPSLAVTNSSSKTNSGVREYKTVETEIPSDPQQAKEAVAYQIQQFRNEGWSVASVSKRANKADGKSYQVWKLFRDKK